MPISEEEIKARLIVDGGIDWGYLVDLRFLDRKDGGTENYITAFRLLREQGVLTSNPKESYFVHFPGLGRSEPVVGGFLFYFVEETHASEFAKRFYPDGLVAKVVR